MGLGKHLKKHCALAKSLAASVIYLVIIEVHCGNITQRAEN